ncbi:MAG TPA: GEVED domain-containing protein, partial [Flavobacteriaceae bacterium]|nr:GEVED domain-containing protein [Flavobacteriaceae bacterium]
MKKNYLTFLLLSVCACFAQAQTTHFIDWDLSVGANASITIDVGDTIEWTNVDIGMPHDVTSTDPNAPAGFGSALLGDFDTYSFTFNAPVVFDYGCGIHPGSMDGTITVITPGGGGYCTPSYNNGCGGGDEIDDFEIPSAGFSHLATGCSPTTYADYTSDANLEITLEVGQNYNFEITHGYGSQRVRMWIDFNQDEVFDHPGELVAEESSIGIGSGATSTVGTIDIPVTAALGTTRMRVMTRYNTQPEPCDNLVVSSWGETHDYTVHIINPLPTCSAPMNLTLNNVTETTAEFSWDASPDESNGYSWVLMNMGDNPETDTPVDQGTVG